MKFLDDMQTSFEDVIPDWVAVGERVLIRPYGSSGVIGFVGTTQFAVGIWIGVELDAPTGKLSRKIYRQKTFCIPVNKYWHIFIR